jgi:hypothetical protein
VPAQSAPSELPVDPELPVAGGGDPPQDGGSGAPADPTPGAGHGGGAYLEQIEQIAPYPADVHGQPDWAAQVIITPVAMLTLVLLLQP